MALTTPMMAPMRVVPTVAAIAAFTAIGRLPQLRDALTDGLNAGLSVNQIKEILVQMYAYAGFPRSLNALGTFMALLEQRRADGIAEEDKAEDRNLNRLGLDVGDDDDE